MEGRSEPQSLTPDPLDPVDPVDPLVNSEWRVLGMKNNENEQCHSIICNTPSVFATFVFQMSTLQRFYYFFANNHKNKVLSSKNNVSGCHISQNDKKTIRVYSVFATK